MKSHLINEDYQDQTGCSVRSTLDAEAFTALLDKVRMELGEAIQKIREGRFHTVAENENICMYCDFADACRKDLYRTRRIMRKTGP